MNDVSKAEAFLRDYKPLGRLKDRADFDTDEEYQKHYNSWSTANYYNEVTSFESRLASANTKNIINYIWGYVICSLVIVLANVGLSLRKSE